MHLQYIVNFYIHFDSPVLMFNFVDFSYLNFCQRSTETCNLLFPIILCCFLNEQVNGVRHMYREQGIKICFHPYHLWASLVPQMVKNPFAMQETQVQSLGLEDPLEEEPGNPLQYSCLENPHGWRNLVGYSPWGHTVGHD